MEQWRADLYHYGVVGMRWGRHNRQSRITRGNKRPLTTMQRVDKGLGVAARKSSNAISNVAANYRETLRSLPAKQRGQKERDVQSRLVQRPDASALRSVKTIQNAARAAGKSRYQNRQSDTFAGKIGNTVYTGARRIGDVRDSIPSYVEKNSKGVVPEKENITDELKEAVDRLIHKVRGIGKGSSTGSVRRPSERPSLRGTKTKRKGR